MFRGDKANTDWILGICGSVCLYSGIRHHDWVIGVIGLACAVAVVFRAARQRFWSTERVTTVPHAAAEVESPRRRTPRRTRPRRAKPTKKPKTTAEFVQQMVSQGRYALLLRPEVAGKLSGAQLSEAKSLVREDMVEVEPGTVRLRGSSADEIEQETAPNKCAEVQAIMIDRFAVTNAQFQQFVESGGYDNDELWDEWSTDWRSRFVDQDGSPGPRYFRNGMCPAGMENHPVVGISWYEADAYARWVGKRLPTDPEWIKAASCPLGKSMAIATQPRYPWGNSVDECRANLWWTGVGGTVDVTAHPDGDTETGARQMIGNVWEWTHDEFGSWSEVRGWVPNEKNKSIRGGAYDSYVESQASCFGGSADLVNARKHNIGFRCVLDRHHLVDDDQHQAESLSTAS